MSSDRTNFDMEYICNMVEYIYIYIYIYIMVEYICKMVEYIYIYTEKEQIKGLEANLFHLKPMEGDFNIDDCS